MQGGFVVALVPPTECTNATDLLLFSCALAALLLAHLSVYFMHATVHRPAVICSH